MAKIRVDAIRMQGVRTLKRKAMPNPPIALVQAISSMETSAVRLACLMMDGARAINCAFENLAQHEEGLRDGVVFPVGSVEFVRRAMELAGIAEPPNLSYPGGCERFLGRRLWQGRAADVATRQFVKPIATKAFTGFVFDPLAPDEQRCEHDREQLAAFKQLPADAMVWCSEVVRFVSEWRYYVLDGEIVGQARYDEFEDEDAPSPKTSVVNDCLRALGLDHPHALDFGVTHDGRTLLVEANDAWAIGLYQRAMPNDLYLRFLKTRWDDLLRQREMADTKADPITAYYRDRARGSHATLAR